MIDTLGIYTNLYKISNNTKVFERGNRKVVDIPAEAKLLPDGTYVDSLNVFVTFSTLIARFEVSKALGNKDNFHPVNLSEFMKAVENVNECIERSGIFISDIWDMKVFRIDIYRDIELESSIDKYVDNLILCDSCMNLRGKQVGRTYKNTGSFISNRSRTIEFYDKVTQLKNEDPNIEDTRNIMRGECRWKNGKQVWTKLGIKFLSDIFLNWSNLMEKYNDHMDEYFSCNSIGCGMGREYFDNLFDLHGTKALPAIGRDVLMLYFGPYCKEFLKKYIKGSSLFRITKLIRESGYPLFDPLLKYRHNELKSKFTAQWTKELIYDSIKQELGVENPIVDDEVYETDLIV